MIVRCTAKMITLLGRPEIGDATPGEDDWYANVIWIERRKCILLMHTETLFCVFVPDVRARDVRPVGSFIARVVSAELAQEGLPLDALGELDSEPATVARTASRRALGFMNEIAREAKWFVAYDGGLQYIDVEDINHRLRRMLHNKDGYAEPIALVRERLANAQDRERRASTEKRT